MPRDVRSHRPERSLPIVIAVIALGLTVGLVPSAEGQPDPNAPPSVDQLRELQHSAEELTEQWHEAKDVLTARRAELDKARADAGAAQAAGDQARRDQDVFQVQVDKLTRATFQGARLNRLSALLTSNSPDELLDQMSVLDLLGTENKVALDRLGEAVQQAEDAEAATKDATDRATKAADEATKAEADINAKRVDMDRRIAVVEEALGLVDDTVRNELNGGGVVDFVLNVAGVASERAKTAVQAALSKQGSPYSWGAEGPGSFDCSGLMLWSYAKAGVGLPRSSSQQARVGQAVGRNQLQPGDLIALYSPVSHIGMYVGDGKYVHAPQSGDVVKVVPVPWNQVTAMRRVA